MTPFWEPCSSPTFLNAASLQTQIRAFATEFRQIGGNFNDNGVLEMADAVSILHYLYLGKAPPSRGTRPGELQVDLTADALGCSRNVPAVRSADAVKPVVQPINVARKSTPVTVTPVAAPTSKRSKSNTPRTLTVGVKTRNGTVPVKVVVADAGDRVLVDIPDIVYRQGGLMTMQHDGDEKTAIGQSGLESKWSADGKKIAYVYVYDIYTVNRDGSDRKRLTNDGTLYRDRQPAWSPDGQQIVFVRDGNLHVITLGSDGYTASMRWITAATTDGAVDSAPAWSPDGSTIAFIREENGSRELYFVDADGGGLTQKTNTPEDEHDPDWHPNGKGIVLSITNGGSDHNVRLISYVGFFPLALDILTHGGKDDRRPSFSPDGTRIAFQRKNEGSTFRTDIYTCNVSGTNQVNLTNLSGDTPTTVAESPNWR